MRKVVLQKRNNESFTMKTVLEQLGLLSSITPSSRIALKPNFTYPRYKPGVTTSPEVIHEVVEVLRDYTSHIAVVETDGGYGAWKASEAFAGHNLHQLRDEFGVEIVNLNNEPREPITFRSRGRSCRLPLPTRLLHETDLLITMPVPKIHCMTGVTLSYKNQWGCVPDVMRLRRHHMFNDAIVAINRALRPVVISDGTFFLDQSGPMEGVPIRMDLIIAASDVGAFDRYVSELMGISWREIQHLRRAVELGDMPSDLQEIQYNASPLDARTHIFQLRRTFRNYIALAGFHSRSLTWLGYESWFGRVVLHSILYAIAGKPIKPLAEDVHDAEDGNGQA